MSGKLMTPCTIPTVRRHYNVLSFDVEEHHRIEAANSYACPPERRQDYAARMEVTTRRILEWLAERNTRATFFIVGEIGRTHPRLVRDIAAAGHEVAAHGWEHRRVDRMTPQQFREDLRRCHDALEQAAGTRVGGFRAPTFSVGRHTPWLVEILLECGFEYDSSVMPVWHDRYGVPDAPAQPFWLQAGPHRILELPPLTYRLAGINWPMGGGGYFRLLPLPLVMAALCRQQRQTGLAVSTLYFHPWEFDPQQPRLPLPLLSRFRTYVGIRRNPHKLRKLLSRFTFRTAIEVVRQIRHDPGLTTFPLTSPQETPATSWKRQPPSPPNL